MLPGALLPLALCGALLGAILGSFIATLVVRRSPLDWSIATGRSRCDRCGRRIAARDLVPIASYGLLRGRARCCGAPIDSMHPAAEVLGALVGALGLALSGWSGLVFGLVLLALALFDVRHFWLPDPLVALLALAGLVLGQGPIVDRLIGMGAGWTILALIGFGYQTLRGREGLGGGDPKLLGAIGAWMGWAPLPMVMVLASVVGLGWAIGLRLGGRDIGRETRLPLGTLMALAAWPMWLWGGI